MYLFQVFRHICKDFVTVRIRMYLVTMYVIDSFLTTISDAVVLSLDFLHSGNIQTARRCDRSKVTRYSLSCNIDLPQGYIECPR